MSNETKQSQSITELNLLENQVKEAELRVRLIKATNEFNRLTQQPHPLLNSMFNQPYNAINNYNAQLANYQTTPLTNIQPQYVQQPWRSF